MNNTHNMTLGMAAKATGKSKTTISKYVKNGKLSIVSKDEKGYQIDPSELFRVFPPINSKHGQSVTPELPHDNPIDYSTIKAEIEVLRVRLESQTQRADNLEEERNDWKNQAQTLLLNPPQKPTEKRKKILGIF